MNNNNIKYFLLYFRAISLILGFLLTNFNKKLITPLPSLINNFIIISIIIFLYELLILFYFYKFSKQKSIFYSLIAADIGFGLLLSSFFGVSYFFLAFLLPFLEISFYFGVLAGILSLLGLSIPYSLLLGLQYFNLRAYPEITNLYLENLELSILSGILFFLFFIFFNKEIKSKEDEIIKIKENLNQLEEKIKEFNETFKNLNNELETKQTISKKLQLEIQQKKIEIHQLKEGLEDVKFQGQELLQLAQKKEQKTTTNLKQEAEKLKSKINLLDKKILNVTKLLEIYQNTNFSTQIEENCLATIESLQNLFPAQTYLLFLLDEVNGKKILFPEVSATPYLEYFKNLTFQLGEGAVGWVAEKLKPLKIDRGEISIENLELSSLIHNEPSVLIAPLFFQNELYGVLYLGRKEKQAFSDEDLEFFSLFTKLASITLSFAYRFHYTIAGGITDDLSGLYNNFYFKERLSEELKRAKRYNFNLGLILINIDHLKKYNETYGMPVGDLILKEFSEVLKIQARETDVTARLDKDNFAIILVQTDKKGTILIAERIRMAVGLRIFAKSLDKKININISLGIASFPQDVKSEEELYNLALQMLKEAKGKGGNQLIFSA